MVIKKYTKSIVLNKINTNQPAYKITLNNGIELICSGNHRWLSNRGWKYTIGSKSGENRRPYLTTNNNLMGFSEYIFDNYEFTIDYKKGYLTGIILGDETINKFDYSSKIDYRNKDIQYEFKLILKEENVTLRTKQYLKDIGIDTSNFYATMIDRKTKKELKCLSIRTRKKEHYDMIKQICNNLDENNNEWLRGFLAGIYDVEGSSNIYIKRFFNTNEKIIKLFEKALTTFKFSYIFDKDKKIIRLNNRKQSTFKFLLIAKPAINNKLNFEGVALKNTNKNLLKIKSIEFYKENMDLIDITTSTENFIANGVVSHNCYAKSLLDFRKLWDPQNPSIADIEKIKAKKLTFLHQKSTKIVNQYDIVLLVR